MILTVTLNPLLERRLIYSNISSGQVNRTNKEIFKAGGKGINISRQLNFLKIHNYAFTFLGGNSGKTLRHILKEEGIEFTPISTKSDTRSAALIVEEDEKRITSCFGPNSEIQKSEADEFKSKLEKTIKNASIVVFAGSSPSEYTDDIFPYGIELANQLDKISILDTYGNHLKACLDKEPTIIHNTVSEVESSLGLNLQDEKSKLDFLSDLYAKNIKMAFLTDGAKPTYASKFDFHYKVENPFVEVIDATGSGDAFVAGITYGLEKALVFDDFVKTAASLGAVNASKWNVCDATLDEMNKYHNEIIVSPIGKKMKIIDDSPNY